MFVEIFGTKRKYKYSGTHYFLFVTLIILDFLIVLNVSRFFLLKSIIIILINAIFMCLYFNIRFIKTLILILLFQGFLIVIDYLDLAIINLFYSETRNPITLSKQSELFAIMGKMVLLFCIMILKKVYGHKPSETLTESEWVKFLFCPIMTIGSITAMIAKFDSINNQEQADILFIVAFSLVCINIIFFYLINDIFIRELKIRENKISQIQAQNQIDLYYSISENFEKQRKKTHEYKNEITCINSLVREKQYNHLEHYMMEINKTLRKELDSIDTNNVIVNAIINVKYQEAQEKGIVFVFKINDLSDIILSDMDVVVILSNLLNNAIEACEHCSDHKLIKTKFVKEENGKIIISVKNTYQQEPIVVKGILHSSKKEDIDEHGIGVKNIIDTLEKYNGSYIIQKEDGMFYFSIIIPA
jgi:Signal transduction histidine kinase regulating citrate/malate metabolism